jgi:hypothetical protein
VGKCGLDVHFKCKDPGETAFTVGLLVSCWVGTTKLIGSFDCTCFIHLLLVHPVNVMLRASHLNFPITAECTHYYSICD